MDRTIILVAGVTCWTIVVVDALIHLAFGDLVVPVGMALVSVTWVGLRHTVLRSRQTVQETATAY